MSKSWTDNNPEIKFGQVVEGPRALVPRQADPVPDAISVMDLQAAAWPGTVDVNLDGDKYVGGFGATKLFTVDYWTLRQRSEQLFSENLYARGLLRRLITNEINTGLTLEATPSPDIIGIDDDTLTAWTEDVETRFMIWGQNPAQCDFQRAATFGKLQRILRMEAMVSGDVLVVLRQDPLTKLPRVQLIPGALVQTPLDDTTTRRGNRIEHGVELDSNDRQVAYHIMQEAGGSKRLPAFGEKSGRRMAWLVYGTERRLDKVRGEPLLALILQSLKEIDRYRDSEQRAAVINASLAMFVKKDQDKAGTLPLTGGATRRDSITITDSDSKARKFSLASMIPGAVIDELQHGETPVSHDTSRPNVNFSGFESAIIHGIAWANEIPPEVLQLAFASNYSASRGAVNEFKLYLNKARADRADEFGKPIYIEWLIGSVLTRKISADGMLEAWRDPMQQDIFGAWVLSDWGGAIKPAVDLAKEVKGYQGLAKEGWITNDRASKELTGTKFSTNIRRVRKENELKAEAMRPLLELEQEFGPEATGRAEASLSQMITSAVEEGLTDGR